jgi:glycosyltransferase involved in cell wall biosynthesis
LAASERAALAQARAVIATSPHTAALLAERFGLPAARITIARPGTDPAPLARGSGGEGCRMLCVATVTPRKGHLLLVEALAGLRHLDWRLLCVGSLARDPAAAAALQARIVSLDLGERVRLLGELDEAALAACWGGADLFVSASLFEGYGMALAEALAHGLPIVAAAGGAGAGTVPRDAGLLVPPGDALALRLALARFMCEPLLAARLRAGALAARDRLPHWPETAARVAKVLASTA